MVQSIAIGIAAGIASALLFMAPISGASLALPLFVLTPLPLALAALGWGVSAGLAAAISGAAIISLLVPGLIAGILFSVVFALPVVWVARLAIMSRPIDGSDPAGALEWFPLGRLLLHSAMAVVAGIVVGGFITGYDPAVIAREATNAFLAFMTDLEPSQPAPTQESVEAFVNLYVALLPFTFSAFMLGILVFNLWLGGVIARSSGKLKRPKEPLWMVQPPNEIVIAFGLALVLAIVLSGPVAYIAAVVAGAFGFALALVGLAVIHAVTRGMAGRGLILTGTYVLTFFAGLPMILFTVLGGAETFLNLRARRSAGAPPTV